MKHLSILLCLGYATSICGAQETKTPVSLDWPGDRFVLVGRLGIKLGEMTTVEGRVVKGPKKGSEGGPNLLVQRVNGKATQHRIQVPIEPYFGEFGEANFDGKPLPLCKPGSTYRLRVYETGRFVGVPDAAYEEAGIGLQTSGFYFRSSLCVLSGNQIDPVRWDPVDFVDREALLFGVAKNENCTPTIEASAWKLILSDANKWEDAQVGKQAEVFGTIRATKEKNVYRVEQCRPRLVSLADQLNKTVALRGTARSWNDHWWFNYRGTDLYVEGMAELPNWTPENHWSPMEISGCLEQAELPRIDQISRKPDRDLATYYIIRRPKWTPLKELLTPEMPADE